MGQERTGSASGPALKPALESTLRQGLDALDLSLTEAQIGKLLAYLVLIGKWTKVYNLTAVRDPADMMTHHLLDSLAVIQPLRRQLAAISRANLSFRQGVDLPSFTGGRESSAVWIPACAATTEVSKEQIDPASHGLGVDATNVSPSASQPVRLLDVGSGAGLPGVVIAICCPDISVHCVDTVAKKAAFIAQVAATLKLPNLRGIHARVENLTEKYDIISARAFASLVDFTSWSAAALAGHGLWMAMKGKHPADEIGALPGKVKVFHVEQLQVPGLAAERCIVWLKISPAA